MAFSAPFARERAEVPFGWSPVGDATYTMTTDTGLVAGGHGFTVATIRSDSERVLGSGVLQQSIRADDFRGQRVRLSGYLKARATDADANLFLRVDGINDVLASDYMESRPVRGVTEWTRYSVVLDVPASAVGLTFGFSLVGSGQVWLDDVSLEIVSRGVTPTGHALGLGGKPQLLDRTARNLYRTAARGPVNLDFEQRLIASLGR